MSRSTPGFGSLLILLFSGVLLVSTTRAQPVARTVNDTVPLDRTGEVTVDNHEGRITITTWDRNEVQYEAEIMPTDEDPNAEKVHIDVQKQNHSLHLATKHEDGDEESRIFGFGEDGWQWGGVDIPAVHYTLTMPTTATLVVDDHESTIDVTGLRNSVRIDTHEGPIYVQDHHGEVRIDSHESRMQLSDIVGNLVIDTHESDLTVDKLKGGLRLDTHDGDATVTFTSLDDDIFVGTHDGDASLSLAEGTGFDIDTHFGDDVGVRSDFDLTKVRISEEDEDEENYHGSVNGGGPEIHLDSHDGDFLLRSHSP